MSEKVQIEIQDSDEQDSSVETAAIENQTSQTPPEAESETKPVADDLTAKLQAAERQAEESYDRLLRASAEFDNYKKRTAREMQDVVKYATEKMAKELLVVVDNLEREIKKWQKAQGCWEELIINCSDCFSTQC